MFFFLVGAVAGIPGAPRIGAVALISKGRGVRRSTRGYREWQ